MLVGKKILLVEDEKFIRELFQMYLLSEGYTVVTADTGPDAVDKFQTEVFDLVLLDIMLPGKDGISVLADVSKINSRVPVAMLTNLADDSLVKRAFELGAVGYFLKARVNKEELLKEVKGFVEAPVTV